MIGLKKLAVTLILLVMMGYSANFFAPAIAAANDKPQSSGKIDEQGLIGRWIRPDGGYILELKDVKKDGSMKASYFNPKPINVVQAAWKRMDGKLTIFIELHDINYPGSKYNLQYNPKTDKLKGTYFQAVYGETYDVEFHRAE